MPRRRVISDEELKKLGVGVEHGAYAAYRKGGCRCAKCTEANSRESKKHRGANCSEIAGRTVSKTLVFGHEGRSPRSWRD